MKTTIMPATDRRPATIDEKRTTAARSSEQAREATLAAAEADSKHQKRDAIAADAMQAAILAGKTEPRDIAAKLTAERDRTRERRDAFVELEKRAHAELRDTIKAEAANGWADAERAVAEQVEADAWAAWLAFEAKMIEAREAQAVARWATDAAAGRLVDYPGPEGYQPITEHVKGLLGIASKEHEAQYRRMKREARERIEKAEAGALAAEQRRRVRYAEQAAAEADLPRKTAQALGRIGRA